MENESEIKCKRNTNPDKPCECFRFVHLEEFTSDFISEIISHSVDLLNTAPDLNLEFVEQPYSDLREADPHYEWPVLGGFNETIGQNAIDEYIRTRWKWEEDWLYCITHTSTHRDECSDYYQYTVYFSIPTKQYPIPQASACVYFTIEVSRIKPLCCCVEVTYKFETSRTIHKPGQLTFREQWLFNIVDAKIKFFKTLTF